MRRIKKLLVVLLSAIILVVAVVPFCALTVLTWIGKWADSVRNTTVGTKTYEAITRWADK